MNKTCVVWICLFLFIGCKYKITDSRFDKSSKIFIEVVENQSLAPQFSSFVNQQLRNHFVRRGLYEIVSNKSKSDLILKINLENYSKNPEVYNPSDTLVAAGFRLNIYAKVTLYDQNGMILLGDSIEMENASVLRKNSLTKPQDRQALSSLSKALTLKIVRLIENFKW